MAINTDLLIDISDEYDEPKYGVSKALSNYTLDEIWNSAYVGANFPVHRMITKSTGEAVRYWSTDTTRPYTIGSLIYQWGQYIGARIASSGAADDDEYAEDGIYSKTIWLYSASTIPQAVTDLTTVRMVTQLDFTRFKLKFTRTTGQSNGEGTPEWGDTRSYGTQKSNAYLLDNSDPGDPVWLESGNIMLIKPYQMIKVDDKYCIIDALTPYYTANYLGGYESDTPKEVVTGYATTDNSVKFGLLQSLKKTTDSYGEIRWYESTWSVNYPSMYDNYKAYMQNRNTSQGYNQTVVYPTTQNEFQKNIMGYGVYFQTDRTYKPIITDGYVTGYTDDLNAASELDGYTGSAIHVVPDSKPGGGGGGGDTDQDDPWHGVSYGTGGYGASPFCTSYAMTGAELSSLAAWGGKTEEQGGPKPGYDYMPSIISLVEMPMEVSGTVPSTVKFSRGTLGGYDSNIVDTGVSGNPITSGTQRYNLGSVTLPLRMSNRGYPFLDWDTVVELYLPFVGMFSLDPFAVLGRTITAFMDLDVLNGTICGYAYVTNNGEKLPVAYGSAQVGVSLPVTSDGAATARLALTTANAQLGSSMASSFLQLGALAAAGGTSAVKGSNAWSSMQSARGAGLAAQTGRNIFAGGASDAVGGYVTGMAQGSVVNSFANWGLSLKQLQSSNNTQVNGSMGGGSFSGWSTPNQAYVKIIRPHAAPGAKASEYGSTHAYPYENDAKLKDCKGLTFAVNPNVSGITKATDAERAQIAEILMGGVIA